MGKNQSKSSWVRWLLVGAVCISTVLSPLALPARPAHAQPPQEALLTALQQVREQLSQLLETYQSADAKAQAAIDTATVQAVRQTLQQTYWSMPASERAELDKEMRRLTGYTWLQLWQGVSTIPELVNAVDVVISALEDLYSGKDGAQKDGAVLGVLTTISGEVLIRTAEGELKSGALGTTLSDGDTVITGADGTAIIEMEGAAIRLESSTHLVIEDWTKGFFELLKGKIRVFIEGFRPMQVETPTAVMAVRGTEFTINLDEDGTTTVVVLDGMGEVRDLTSNAIVLLEAFQMITVPKIPGGLEQQDMLGRVTRVDPEGERLPSAPTPLVGGPVILIVVILLVIVIILVPTLLLSRRRARRQVKETSAEWLETLKMRLAKGEITQEEYEELKKRLKET